MSCARAVLFAVATAFVSSACARPEPPTITPIAGRVVSISASGIKVEAKLEAYNPNGFDIRVERATTHLVLDRTFDAGTVTLPFPVDLPAKQRKDIDVPVALSWTDALQIAPMAISNRDVPYVADGTIRVSAASLELDLPFKVTGFVTHQQLVQAVRSLPTLKGLELPF